MQKYGEEQPAVGGEVSGKNFTVKFLPEDKEVTVEEGKTIFEAIEKADIFLNSSCSGRGICGKCKVRIEEGKYERTSNPYLTAEEVDNGYILACSTPVMDNLTVSIPLESQRRKLKFLDDAVAATDLLHDSVVELSPVTQRVSIDLPPPSIEDSSSDLDWVTRTLRQAGHISQSSSVDLSVIRKLGEALRKNNWNANLTLLKENKLCEIPL